MKKQIVKLWIVLVAFSLLGMLILSLSSCLPAFGRNRYPVLSEQSTNCDNLVTMKDFKGHDIVIVGCSGDRCAFHSPECRKCKQN